MYLHHFLEKYDNPIHRAIDASGGNLTLAARQLGIAKSTLYVKMQRYGLSRAGAGRRAKAWPDPGWRRAGRSEKAVACGLTPS